MEIKLSLIRHGATKSNLEHRYLGVTDEALSEAGVWDLLQRKKEGVYSSPEKIFISPMLRCRQSAELLFEDAEFGCIPEWREINFGLFEGKNYLELNEDILYQKWINSNGSIPFPEGEGRGEFIARVMRGFEKMMSILKKEEVTKMEVAAVVHGGTIMALLSGLFGGDYYDYQIGAGEGYECRFLYGAAHQVELLGLRKI